MKIAVVTVWCNEEDLAPFFLKHYSYVDDIFVYLDTATNDNTRSICSTCPKVTIRRIAYPQGYDPAFQVRTINQAARALKYDWVYAVDADEFIQQPKQYKSAKEFLLKQQKQGCNLVFAKMFQVYRHVTDKDLDVCQPVLAQRCHGDPDLSTVFNRCYIKPNIVKPEVGIVWRVGCHNYRRNGRVKVAREQFFGAHWKMADPGLAIKRRMHNQARLSKKSRKKGRLWQDAHITKKAILEALKKHSHDPNVLGSYLRGT